MIDEMGKIDEPPTVCHVLHSLEVGGAEVLARRFALGLHEQFRPVFACLDACGALGESLRERGIPVQVLERRPGVDVRCIWRLRRWLKSQRVRLIHAHQYTPFFYAAVARTGFGTPVLFTEHGRHHPDVRSAKRVWVNQWLLRPRDRVVAVGEHVREALIQNEGIAEDRVSVIYNGVDERAYDVGRHARASVRRELGYSDDDVLILQVARLNRLKDHATAIRAVELLRRSVPHVKLVLAGDGEERPALETLVASLGVESVVRFLGTRQDIPRLLQAADAFLLSSISEGIPLTLVEAMLSGVPVVATRVGGVPEVVEDGVTGLLASAGDASGLAQKLRQLITDGDLNERMACAAKWQALHLFTESQMLRSYSRAYAQMMPAPATRSSAELPEVATAMQPCGSGGGSRVA